MITRQNDINSITKHISDERDMTDANVHLVAELVFALTWSKETATVAEDAMRKVVAANQKERGTTKA